MLMSRSLKLFFQTIFSWTVVGVVALKRLLRVPSPVLV